MIELSMHARKQAVKRLFDAKRVLDAVSKAERAIKHAAQVCNDPHVYVIVYKFRREINRPGCRGDNLVACCDLTTNKITTIMLQPTNQIERNKQFGLPYVEA